MIEHLEGVVDSAIASIAADLPDVIATINAETGAANPAAIELEMPDPRPVEEGGAIYFGGFDIVKYPSIEIASPDFSLADFDLDNWSADLRAVLMVRGHVMDANAARVLRRAYRFGRALLQVLLQPDAFGAGVQIRKDDGVRGYYRFNPETGEREEIFGSTLLVFALEGSENRG